MGKLYHVSTLQKVKRVESEALTKEIFRFDTLYASGPTPVIYKECLYFLSKYDLLYTSKTQKQLFLSKQRFFETGQVRAATLFRLIHKIKSMVGVVTSDPVEITKILNSFYSNLYSSQCPSDVWDGDSPLDKIVFPKINVVWICVGSWEVQSQGSTGGGYVT